MPRKSHRIGMPIHRQIEATSEVAEPVTKHATPAECILHNIDLSKARDMQPEELTAEDYHTLRSAGKNRKDIKTLYNIRSEGTYYNILRRLGVFPLPESAGVPDPRTVPCAPLPAAMPYDPIAIPEDTPKERTDKNMETEATLDIQPLLQECADSAASTATKVGKILEVLYPQGIAADQVRYVPDMVERICGVVVQAAAVRGGVVNSDDQN